MKDDETILIGDRVKYVKSLDIKECHDLEDGEEATVIDVPLAGIVFKVSFDASPSKEGNWVYKSCFERIATQKKKRKEKSEGDKRRSNAARKGPLSGQLDRMEVGESSLFFVPDEAEKHRLYSAASSRAIVKSGRKYSVMLGLFIGSDSLMNAQKAVIITRKA